MADDQKKITKEEEATPQDDALSKLEKERAEYLEGWQRARADFSNYKKQEMERFSEALRYAEENMMSELIRVLDSFDLGLSTLEKQGPVDKGVYMIRAQLEDVMKRRGLERIPVKPGDPFDPAVAESIGEVAADLSPGSVAEEIEPGYRLMGKVIRPARVRLVKH